jgi:hypothetical protein
MLKTRGFISSYYIGSRGGRGTVGLRGKDYGKDAGRKTGVSGERERGGREGREEVPDHVAQTGTLTSQGGDSRGGAGPRCTDGPFLDRKRGIAGGGDHPRCTDGHTLAGGSGGREG